MQPNSEQRNGALFKATFLRLLLERFPSWRSSISDSAEPYSRVEISPPNWDGPPLRVDIRPPDTVTVSPVQFRPLLHIHGDKTGPGGKIRPRFHKSPHRYRGLSQRSNHRRHTAAQILVHESRLGRPLLARHGNGTGSPIRRVNCCLAGKPTARLKTSRSPRRKA